MQANTRTQQSFNKGSCNPKVKKSTSSPLYQRHMKNRIYKLLYNLFMQCKAQKINFYIGPTMYNILAFLVFRTLSILI